MVRSQGRAVASDLTSFPLTFYLVVFCSTSAMQRFTTTTRTALRTISGTRSLHLSRPLLSSKAPESDLTHPALLRDPPAEKPTDPWSLTPPPPPPTPQGPAPTMQELLSSPHPEGRDDEQTETLRKRLVYESRKRGILEMDLILGTFAKSRLQELDDGQLREYDRVSSLLRLSRTPKLADSTMRDTVPHPPRLVHLLLCHRQGSCPRTVEEQLDLERVARSCRESRKDCQADARPGGEAVDRRLGAMHCGRGGLYAGEGERESRRSGPRLGVALQLGAA
jgi:hypothetical protein